MGELKDLKLSNLVQQYAKELDYVNQRDAVTSTERARLDPYHCELYRRLENMRKHGVTMRACSVLEGQFSFPYVRGKHDISQGGQSEVVTAEEFDLYTRGL